jgi:hypothetical protein
MKKILLVLVLGLLASGCIVQTSAGTFECLWTPNGVVCEAIQHASLP